MVNKLLENCVVKSWVHILNYSLKLNSLKCNFWSSIACKQSLVSCCILPNPLQKTCNNLNFQWQSMQWIKMGVSCHKKYSSTWLTNGKHHPQQNMLNILNWRGKGWKELEQVAGCSSLDCFRAFTWHKVGMVRAIVYSWTSCAVQDHPSERADEWPNPASIPLTTQEPNTLASMQCIGCLSLIAQRCHID